VHTILWLSFSGIVGYANGLIIVSTAGGLWYHDLRSNGRRTTTAATAVLIATAAETGTGGHGLALDGNRLCIAHSGGGGGGRSSSSSSSAQNVISVFDLMYDDDNDQTVVRATRVDALESPLLDSPTALALSDGLLYVTNARSNSLPFPSPNEGNLTLFREQFTVVAIETSDMS
jgi:hypothetical protein